MANNRHWYGRTRLMSKTNVEKALTRLIDEASQLGEAVRDARYPTETRLQIEQAAGSLKNARTVIRFWRGIVKS